MSLVDESGRVVSGCDCRDACSDCPCSCLDGLDVGRECGPGCRCGPECGSRSSQKGVAVRVKIVRDGRKGWALCADQFIRKGQFVFEYAGNLKNRILEKSFMQIIVFQKMASEAENIYDLFKLITD